MKVHYRYKHQLFLYYFTVFALLTSGFIAFQYQREKQFRVAQLETTLRNITDVTSLFIRQTDALKERNIHLLDSLNRIIPQPETRITVISIDGKVLYDSFVKDFQAMENHLKRPEVQKALYSDYGSNIRHSKTTNKDFYYYARNYDDYFIRAAVVYNIKIQHFLQAEPLFLFFIIFVFVVAWLVLSYVTNRLSKSIIHLKDVVTGLNQGETYVKSIVFPDNELGAIGKRMVTIYNKLAHAKQELLIEREKLMTLLYVLKEGIGFFTAEKESILNNSNFVQYVNFIAGNTSINPEHIFKEEAFKPVNEYLNFYLKDDNVVIHEGDLIKKEFILQRSGRDFNVLCIIFQDRSFEIIIADIT